MSEKPIAAIATPPGCGGISVIRISGSESWRVAQKVIQRKGAEIQHGIFFHSAIEDSASGEIIDSAIVLFFKAPKSYTGEDCVEIQGHGGVVSAERLLRAVINAGARVAEPGEFTKRAFLNGRIDLTQAEAVCDLIQAQTERAAVDARRRLDGQLGHAIDALYGEMLDIASAVEHLLDFDESELDDEMIAQFDHRLIKVQKQLQILMQSWHQGEMLRHGALVVLYGEPNAGKSSLLNALLKRNRAIVHDKPGTTRDIIEEFYSLCGVPVRLVDTAGLCASPDAVECEGMRRARDLMAQAAMNLLIIDSCTATQSGVDAMLRMTESSRIIAVFNKSDLQSKRSIHLPAPIARVSVSALKNEGLEELQQTLSRQLGITQDFLSQTCVNQRHMTELKQSVDECQLACAILGRPAKDLAVVAGHLREATEALGRITGKTHSDDLLDNIFRKFCVGK
jgi:tRNA modification GTPase